MRASKVDPDAPKTTYFGPKTLRRDLPAPGGMIRAFIKRDAPVGAKPMVREALGGQDGAIEYEQGLDRRAVHRGVFQPSHLRCAAGSYDQSR
jgi:hypothetical protein